MMKPATPLPWTKNDAPVIGGIYGADDSKLVGANELPRHDAAYIVHACNSYPRLVEALKTHSCNYKIGHPLVTKPCEICELLKEIGE